MIKKIATLVVLGLLVSCESNEEIVAKSGDVRSALSSGSKSDTELKDELKEYTEKENLRITKLEANSTTLEFDKLTHDYGDVLPDSDNNTVFLVTNTGDKPLILEDVSASCGCTMPRKPEKPILPGESDVIEVTFHPKPGQVNEIKKSITVTANTMKKVHMLEIRAFVKK
tara:strand:+ start:374 stop:883 length:510 start_codon:yes stop_codon:yes gene_type:complete